jgi:hypothetical protein
MFYKVIEEYSDIINNFSVLEFRKYGSAVSLVAKVEFINSSILYIRDYLFLDGRRKYSYHWQDSDGSLISRWDNSPHHREISTFPHHRHISEKIILSRELDIRDIFKTIKREIK